MGGPIKINQTNTPQPSMALKYGTNAVAEKVKEKAIKAFPVRLNVVEKLIAARPTSQTIYQGKNHGVTTRSNPNVASVASIIVCVVGLRHKQTAPILNTQKRATRLIVFQTM